MHGSHSETRSLLALVVTGLLAAGPAAAAEARAFTGTKAQPAPLEPAAPATPATPGAESPKAPAADQPAGEPAPLAPAAAAPEHAAAGPFPVGMMLGISHAVGSGTFSANPYTRNPLFASNVTIRPKIRLPFKFSLALRQDVDLEWTKSESTTFDKQPILSDPRAGLRYEGLDFPIIGLKFTFYGGARAPVSLESRFKRQLGTLDMSALVEWSMFGFRVSTSLMGAGNLRMRGKPVYDNSLMSQWWGTDDEARDYTDRNGKRITPRICIARASEAASGGCPAVGAANGTLGTISTNSTIGYDFGELTPVPVSIELGLITMHALSDYWGPDDQYTPNHANTGIVRRDLTWGTLSVSWQVFPWLSLDAGTASMQPLMYSNNKVPRFPWWNIPYWDLGRTQNYSDANNFSQFTTGATFVF